MTAPDAFRDQPVLTGTRVRLEPLCADHAEAMAADLVDLDPQVRRLTGTHRRFTAEQVRRWCATRPEQHDRADWAVVRTEDGRLLGDTALIDFDPDNARADFRIALNRTDLCGRGYGGEAVRLVLDHAFDTVGLHRVGLQVYDFNRRAQRVYERCGFTREGVWRQALYWDGAWHDAVLMSVLAGDR